MYTKQQKSALTREINSMRNNLEYEMNAVNEQKPDQFGMVWRFGEKKHHIGYINGLIRELNNALKLRADMDGKTAELLPLKKVENSIQSEKNIVSEVTTVNENNSLTDVSAVSKSEMIEKFMIENDILLTDVIDVLISNNGFIGVGLITLGEQLKEYVHGKISVNREMWNN